MTPYLKRNNFFKKKFTSSGWIYLESYTHPEVIEKNSSSSNISDKKCECNETGHIITGEMSNYRSVCIGSHLNLIGENDENNCSCKEKTHIRTEDIDKASGKRVFKAHSVISGMEGNHLIFSGISRRPRFVPMLKDSFDLANQTRSNFLKETEADDLNSGEKNRTKPVFEGHDRKSLLIGKKDNERSKSEIRAKENLNKKRPIKNKPTRTNSDVSFIQKHLDTKFSQLESFNDQSSNNASHDDSMQTNTSEKQKYVKVDHNNNFKKEAIPTHPLNILKSTINIEPMYTQDMYPESKISTIEKPYNSATVLELASRKSKNRILIPNPISFEKNRMKKSEKRVNEQIQVNKK